MAFAFLSAITSCIKYMLFVFNLLFVITGIIIISVGAAVQEKYHGYSPFLIEDGSYFSVPAFLIAIGVIIFIIAFFGCCGAVKENYFMVLCFSILLILVFILELAAGISGYVLRDRTHETLEKSLHGSIEKYYNVEEKEIMQVWDDMQSGFGCCGVSNYSDWTKGIPLACCKIPPGVTNVFYCNDTTNKDYPGSLPSYGCLSGLEDFVEEHAASLGAAGICIALVQFVGILFACHLAKRIKYETGA